MSADSEKLHGALLDQLVTFEDRLDGKADDVEMLAEIQAGIRGLLASGDSSEAEIRRVLQERYEAGQLRQETFQLVKSMLDRYVTEIIETSPSIAEASAVLEGGLKVERPVMPPQRAPETSVGDDDVMGSTMVLPGTDAPQSDDPDARVQVGSVLRDRFLLQERISGGAMGVIYKAMDRRLAEAGADEPWVAIKVLAPQLSRNGKALRALQQEAAKGRTLVHPNIVRFIDLDRDEDLYFIVMEWLEGRTLADILDSPDAKNIDVERAFRIVRQVGRALEYAHKCGIVHADVKPGNIMMMPNGDAKLFDFGVARVRQEQAGQKEDFDPGVLGLLTPAYSSMQVLTGERPVPSDDVFSLACLLYRLIAGFRVFGPRNAAEAADEGMTPQQPQGLGDAQWRVLKKALSYPRVTRFESMTDFIEALDVQEAESMTVDMPAPVRFSESDDSGNASRWIIGGVILVALSVVGANQLGYLDELKARYLAEQPAGDAEFVDAPELESAEVAPTIADKPGDVAASEPVDDPPGADRTTEPETEVEPAGVPIEDAPFDDLENAIAEFAAENDETIIDPAAETEVVEDAIEVAEDVAGPAVDVDIPEPEQLAAPLVDFSALPPPTAIAAVSPDVDWPRTVTVTLNEAGGEATVDLVRRDTSFPRTLRVEEVSYSGSRSPWATGQYAFSDNGVLEFPAGQDRARITLSMAPDNLREADQQSVLRIRDADTPDAGLATITVVLEDDDQRVFESTLPANTVAFAVSQVTVNEADPAVQLDIIRYNPDDQPMRVGYTLRDITASQGEDYFAPGGYTIEFGPGQRSTRLLIPLVQDSTYEDNEAFSVELSTAESTVDTGIFRRVAVLIRDDDQ
jgi:serine/threonine protein kinase